MGQLVEHHPTKQRVTSLSPGEGAHLGCGPGPQLQHVWKATGQCLSHTSIFLSLSFSLPSPVSKNKWRQKQKQKKKQSWTDQHIFDGLNTGFLSTALNGKEMESKKIYKKLSKSFPFLSLTDRVKELKGHSSYTGYHLDFSVQYLYFL